MSNNLSMQDPVAFFLTWPTYGTWLPGNDRGWVEYHRGWHLPNPHLENLCRTSMSEKQCLLSEVERSIVVQQIRETCGFRGWQLFAVDCRSNHCHIVVGAFETDPVKIRKDLKAWCTRRLKAESCAKRKNWWAERGSIRYVWTEESLDCVVDYVNEAQDRKGRES